MDFQGNDNVFCTPSRYQFTLNENLNEKHELSLKKRKQNRISELEGEAGNWTCSGEFINL